MGRLCLLFAVVVVGCGFAWGGAQKDVGLTGEMGDSSRLLFGGNETFSSSAIVKGLYQDSDFLLAGHPVGPLSEYVKTIEEKVKAGYLKGGFPDVEVVAKVERLTGKIFVMIKEGPRYMRGDITVAGGDKSLRRAIKTRLGEAGTEEPSLFSESLSSKNLWRVGKPVSFVEDRCEYLKAAVKVILAEYGYFFPWVDIEIVRDDDKRNAALSVEIKDLGPKGVVDSITIEGNQRDSRREILDYLGLTDGMDFNSELVLRTQELLRKSGRFVSYEVNPLPVFSTEPKLKLNIKVKEHTVAPGLSEELSRLEKTLLAMGEYLADWQQGDEDVVVTMANLALRSEVQPLLKCVLSPSKGVVIGVWKDGEEKDSGFVGALAIMPEEVTFYSNSGGHKMTFSKFWQTLILQFGLSHIDDPTGSRSSYVNLGMGIATYESGSPVKIELDVSPCYLMREAARYKSQDSEKNHKFSYEGDLLNCQNDDYRMQIDTTTGRLVELQAVTAKAGDIAIRTKVGAFDELIGEIESRSDKWVNGFDADRPVSSAVAFMWKRVSDYAVASKDDQDQAKRIKSRTEAFGKILDEIMPASLDRLFARGRESHGEKFVIPVAFSVGDNITAKLLERLSAVAFRFTNEMFGRDSWPWTLSRETVFILGGKGKYSGRVLQGLYESGEMGPLGYLTTAKVMGRISPQMGTVFATRGLDKLSVEDFRTDIQAFLKGDAVLADCLVEIGTAFRQLSDEEVDFLMSLFANERTEPVRRALEILCTDKSRPVRQILPDACDQLWEPFLRARVKELLEKMSSRASAMNY